MTKNRERTAKMSNELTRAKWNIDSVLDARVLVSLAAQAKEDILTYEIKVGDLFVTQNLGGKTYKDVWQKCSRLMGKSVTITLNDGFELFSIFNYMRYQQKAGVITVELTKFALAHLVNLKKNYTTLDVHEFIKLSSVYSQRLYMLLKSWCSLPEITIPLSDLTKKINTTPSLARYSNFHQFILKPTTKEINAKTSLRYTWEPIKKGRSVHAIRFIFASTRIEEAKQKKKHEVSVKNNELVLSAYKCAKTKTGECTQETKSKKCDVCKKLKLK